MFNVKELEDAIFAMQQLSKLPKGTKVTRLFARYLTMLYPPIDIELLKVNYGFLGEYQGLPVFIDDEIEGYYEIIY